MVFGFSLGFKNGDVSKVDGDEIAENTEVVGRNITIELNDGITFRATP